jgi:hypothetical protein
MQVVEMTPEVTTPRVGRIATALAWIIAVSACRDATPRAPMVRVRTAVPAPAPTRPPRRPEAWTEALSLRAGVADFSPRANVLAHAPEGFDPRGPLHLVVLLHGYSHTPYYWLGGGMTDPRTGQRIIGWGGRERHDLAGTNTLFIAPQCDDRPGHRRMGNLSRPEGLRAFFDELLGPGLGHRLGGARGLDDVATITLVGSSAGGPSIGALLSRPELAARVRTVVLFDGLYGDPGVFARWVLGAPTRRLVQVYSGSAEAEAHTTALAGLLAPRLGAGLVRVSRETMGDAVRSHRAVLARVPCEHIGMVSAYLDKILEALDLPRRERPWDPKVPRVTVSGEAPTLGEGVTAGRLQRGDGVMRDGSLFDRYALSLAAGERAVVEVLGGRVPMLNCATLDTELRVCAGGVEVAASDDALPGRGSRVTLTATRATRYEVRVTAHGPWAREGPYTLTVRREARADAPR